MKWYKIFSILHLFLSWSIEGDKAEKLNKALKSLTYVASVNVKYARRLIADKLIADIVYQL